MTGRARAATAAALVLVAALAWLVMGTGRFQQGPVLTIHLRCAPAAEGSLTVWITPASGAAARELHSDVRAACAAGQLQLPHFQDDADLHARLVRNAGDAAELLARNGSDIQRDRQGYFTVLRINASPPYLANDRV